LNGTLTKSISAYLGLALMFFGFIVCVMGFGDSINAGWGTSFAIRGLSELLFGISFMILGNGLVTFAKK
jgi:cytochrome c biogenesis protein CcdA